MSPAPAPQFLRVGRRLAVLAGLALVVALVALVTSLSSLDRAPRTPQDSLAGIPMSTATPYPFATTSTPWKTEPIVVDRTSLSIP